MKLESLNAREAAIEKRMSDFEQKEQELAQSKADLKQKWNEYQQHAEALRNTRNRLPAEIPAHTSHSTSSKHENSLNTSNISTASSSLHSAPKKQPRPRENPSREHARRSDQNQIQRKDNNQLPLRDQIFV